MEYWTIALRMATHHHVKLTFRDSAGTRWLRAHDGRLEELRAGLLIWSDERLAESLGAFAQEILSESGVRSSTYTTDDTEELRAKVLSTSDSGDPPDVLVGPHDWIGDLEQRQLLAPIILSKRRSGVSLTLPMQKYL